MQKKNFQGELKEKELNPQLQKAKQKLLDQENKRIEAARFLLQKQQQKHIDAFMTEYRALCAKYKLTHDIEHRFIIVPLK